MTIEKHIRCQITVINVVIPFTDRDFNALQRSINAKYATNTVTFSSLCYQKKTQAHHKNSC